MIKEPEKFREMILESSVEDINIDFLSGRLLITLKKNMYDINKLYIYELVLEDLNKVDYYGLMSKGKIRSYIEFKNISILEVPYLGLVNKGEDKYYKVEIELSENLFNLECKRIFLNVIFENFYS